MFESALYIIYVNLKKVFILFFTTGSSLVKDLLWNLLLLQERLLEQNIETKNILCGGTDTNQSKDIDDNEEIPSDTEDEDEDEEKGSVKELKTSRNEKEKETLKLPVKRKHSMVSKKKKGASLYCSIILYEVHIVALQFDDNKGIT